MDAKGEKRHKSTCMISGRKMKKQRRSKKPFPLGSTIFSRKRVSSMSALMPTRRNLRAPPRERWWKITAKQEYPQASEILLFADCGSSNGYQNRLWKYCLQQFANNTGLS